MSKIRLFEFVLLVAFATINCAGGLNPLNVLCYRS